jgi:hypothetical protein
VSVDGDVPRYQAGSADPHHCMCRNSESLMPIHQYENTANAHYREDGHENDISALSFSPLLA